MYAPQLNYTNYSLSNKIFHSLVKKGTSLSIFNNGYEEKSFIVEINEKTWRKILLLTEKKSQVAVIEREEELLFRTPTEEDGKEVWQLIKNTGVLDLNSSYSYLMWSKFFDETSVVVEVENQIVGFISGFIQPNSPETLFIWQVAVDESARGKGLASRMLHAILHRDACRNIRCLEATVSPSNEASQALFRKLARDLNTVCEESKFFTANQFPGSGHEDEDLFKIGPFQLG